MQNFVFAVITLYCVLYFISVLNDTYIFIARKVPELSQMPQMISFHSQPSIRHPEMCQYVLGEVMTVVEMLLQPDLRNNVCSIMLYLPECRETLLHSLHFSGTYIY